MIVKGGFFVAEKENASRLRAADFARICGTNKRTLHHYDQIGLFAPALRGENGYRYYSQEQYDVFMVISALKELGMPLLDIKAYLDRSGSPPCWTSRRRRWSGSWPSSGGSRP